MNNRRKVIKKLSIATAWSTPLVQSVVIPAHAQTSQTSTSDVLDVCNADIHLPSSTMLTFSAITLLTAGPVNTSENSTKLSISYDAPGFSGDVVLSYQINNAIPGEIKISVNVANVIQMNNPETFNIEVDLNVIDYCSSIFYLQSVALPTIDIGRIDFTLSPVDPKCNPLSGSMIINATAVASTACGLPLPIVP